MILLQVDRELAVTKESPRISRQTSYKFQCTFHFPHAKHSRLSTSQCFQHSQFHRDSHGYQVSDKQLAGLKRIATLLLNRRVCGKLHGAFDPLLHLLDPERKRSSQRRKSVYLLHPCWLKWKSMNNSNVKCCQIKRTLWTTDKSTPSC